jgi:hypothetical protein
VRAEERVERSEAERAVERAGAELVEGPGDAGAARGGVRGVAAELGEEARGVGAVSREGTVGFGEEGGQGAFGGHGGR